MKSFEKNYGSVINWNVGALCCHDEFMLKLLDKFQQYQVPHSVKYVFGSIPCALQGGRLLGEIKDHAVKFDSKYNVAYAFDMFRRYNNHGIGCRLTFSHTALEPELFQDKQSNALLSYLNSSPVSSTGIKNGVIVTDLRLAEYIRKNYPNLELICSIVGTSSRCILGKTDTIDYYKQMLELFDLVVLNPGRNTDFEFLNDLPDHDRFEIMANHACVKNCPTAKIHYEAQQRLVKASLDGDQQTINAENEKLARIKRHCQEYHELNPLDGCSLNDEEMKQIVSMGFINYKLEGRDNSTNFLMRDIGQYLFQQNLYARFVQATMSCYMRMYE